MSKSTTGAARAARPDVALVRRLHRLGRSYIGKFAVIEPGSGRYFIADRGIDAILKARKAMPGHVFFMIRIGHRAAVSHRGGLRRA